VECFELLSRVIVYMVGGMASVQLVLESRMSVESLTFVAVDVERFLSPPLRRRLVIDR
jgi:hypothetical protein